MPELVIVPFNSVILVGFIWVINSSELQCFTQLFELLWELFGIIIEPYLFVSYLAHWFLQLPSFKSLEKIFVAKKAIGKWPYLLTGVKNKGDHSVDW